MNYYERHLGDYSKDTAHLSMLEHGAYTLLMDRYYSTEQGIPADQAHRVARARAREEKAAVDAVLQEFFELVDGVYIQNRIETEIGKYLAKAPQAEEKRENGKARQRRARERRAAMFAQLAEYGVTMPWNATTEQLQSAIDNVLSRTDNAPVTQPVTRDNTANQAPVTSNQTPDLKPIPRSDSSDSVRGVCSGAVELSIAMRSAGINSQPADPRLMALAEQGVAPETVTAACEEAKHSKPGQHIRPAYVYSILERWASEASRLRVAGAKPPSARASPSGRQTQQDKATALADYLTRKDRNHAAHTDIIDINPAPAGSAG